MVIQAIGLLDDRDKKLHRYAMRVRKRYGWHFPELAKIVEDNILYAKAVQLMGDRTNAVKLDFSEILPEEVETELKEAAMISKGTEVSDLDLMKIKYLCNQVLSLAEYRAQLYDYLKSQMDTIAPNLTALVGEVVGARLIAHGGSLLNLAKQPGSTIQILGAGKGLKYGLISHAPLIGRYKRKIERALAAKTALAIRCDALGDNHDNSMGLESRLKLEARLRNPQGGELVCSDGSAEGKPRIQSYNKDQKKGAEMLITPAKTYNPSADSVVGQMEAEAEKDEETVAEGEPSRAEEAGGVVPAVDKEKKDKKEKKKKESAEVEGTGVVNDGVENEDVGKKEKKKKKYLSDDTELQNEGEKKKRKRKHAEADGETEKPSKKKEKRKKKKTEDLDLDDKMDA